MRDSHIHAEKTIFGTSLAFGATVGTGCGKRRERERTSTDPAVVTCPECRKWGAAQELEMAANADAVASLPAEFLAGDGVGWTADDFRNLARQHRATAQKWSI
jgi:hypothetical protein